MLTVNGQALQGSTKEVAFIKKELENIKKGKNFVIFQDSRLTAKNRKQLFSAHGRKMGDAKPPARMIANIDKWHDEKEKLNPVTVAYTKGIVTIQRDGVVDIPRKNIMFEDFWSLNPEKDYELIFFLRHVSSSIKRGEIVEFNEEKEAEKKMTTFVGDSELKYNIAVTLNPKRNMEGNEIPLRTIAASWNVKNAEDGNLDKVSMDLYDAVMESEKKKQDTKRGIKEFMDDVHAIMKGDYSLIKLRADMQKAMDKKILEYVDNRLVFMKDSPIEKEFFRIKPSDINMKFEKLVYHINNNSRDLDMVLDEMEKSSTEEDRFIREITDMEDIDELRKIATEMDVDLRGAPGISTIKKKIKEHVEKNGL